MRSIGLFLLGGVLLVGCAGSGSGSSSGTAPTTAVVAVNISWPARSRQIPISANSIKVQFFEDADLVSTQLVVRPNAGGTSSLSFTASLAHTLKVVFKAYGSTDGTGTPVGVGTTIADLNVANPTVNVTLSSTINQLILTPSIPENRNGKLVLQPGQQSLLTVTPVDSAGRTVLTLPQSITFSINGDSSVGVDSDGLITANTVGDVFVVVKEADSGVQALLPVHVTLVNVGLNPSSLTGTIGDQIALNPVVTGTQNTNVTWTTTAGVITNNVYNATTAGDIEVTATSVADTEVSASVILSISAGSGGIIIR